MLWGIKLQNCFPDDVVDAFVEFDIGGDRQEVLVQAAKQTKVYAVGELKNRVRTSVAYGCEGNEQPVDIDYRVTSEYRGSYSNIESEKIKIRVSLLKSQLSLINIGMEFPSLASKSFRSSLRRAFIKFCIFFNVS